MKLIVAGASGFVATEVIRRSLSHPQITSVIALSRQLVSVPENLDAGADPSKLHSAVVQKYDEYTDDVKKQLANADACIWTIAVTPAKSRLLDFESVRHICQEYTLTGLKTIVEARGSSTTRFRFLYMSGIAAERDQTKTPRFMAPYSLMRGETETQVLAFAAEHQGVEACVAKPGIILTTGKVLQSIFATALKWAGVVPNISLTEIAAAMLDQVVNGFEKEPLLNDDLVRIGNKILKSVE